MSCIVIGEFLDVSTPTLSSWSIFPSQIAPGETLYTTVLLVDASGVSWAWLQVRHTQTDAKWSCCESGILELFRVSGTQKNGTWSTSFKLPVSGMIFGAYSIRVYISDIMGLSSTVYLGNFTVIQSQVIFRCVLCAFDLMRDHHSFVLQPFIIDR